MAYAYGEGSRGWQTCVLKDVPIIFVGEDSLRSHYRFLNVRTGVWGVVREVAECPDLNGLSAGHRGGADGHV